MSCLTVRDLSPRTLHSLKMRAKTNHRSLNGEILFIFDWVVDSGMNTPPPVAGLTDPAVARQKSAMETLIGTWGDKRGTEEIAKGIYAARTFGREVNL